MLAEALIRNTWEFVLIKWAYGPRGSPWSQRLARRGQPRSGTDGWSFRGANQKGVFAALPALDMGALALSNDLSNCPRLRYPFYLYR